MQTAEIAALDASNECSDVRFECRRITGIKKQCGKYSSSNSKQVNRLVKICAMKEKELKWYV